MNRTGKRTYLEKLNELFDFIISHISLQRSGIIMLMKVCLNDYEHEERLFKTVFREKISTSKINIEVCYDQVKTSQKEHEAVQLANKKTVSIVPSCTQQNHHLYRLVKNFQRFVRKRNDALKKWKRDAKSQAFFSKLTDDTKKWFRDELFQDFVTIKLTYSRPTLNIIIAFTSQSSEEVVTGSPRVPQNAKITKSESEVQESGEILVEKEIARCTGHTRSSSDSIPRFEYVTTTTNPKHGVNLLKFMEFKLQKQWSKIVTVGVDATECTIPLDEISKKADHIMKTARRFYLAIHRICRMLADHQCKKMMVRLCIVQNVPGTEFIKLFYNGLPPNDSKNVVSVNTLVNLVDGYNGDSDCSID